MLSQVSYHCFGTNMVVRSARDLCRCCCSILKPVTDMDQTDSVILVRRSYSRTTTSILKTSLQIINSYSAATKASGHTADGFTSLQHTDCWVATMFPLGKIRHKNVIRRHDETRRRNDLGNWLYMKVSRTSLFTSRRFYDVITMSFTSRCHHNVSTTFCDVKRRPENFHIQLNIHVLSTSGFDGPRLAEWVAPVTA